MIHHAFRPRKTVIDAGHGKGREGTCPSPPRVEWSPASRREAYLAVASPFSFFSMPAIFCSIFLPFPFSGFIAIDFS